MTPAPSGPRTIDASTYVVGPDGSMQATVRVAIVFTAIRQDGDWRIQDERAHFKTHTVVS